MRRLVVLLLALAAVAGGWLWWRSRHAVDPAAGYRFVTVERGDLERVVSATGALEALNTVEVGTQVSGQLAEILVDYNDSVRRGQLVARIDPTLLEQSVRESRASVERSKVELARAERDYARARQLFAAGLLADNDLGSAQYDAESARAALTSAEAALARAEQSLAYTSIYSPIDGVVIERNVDVGQTVAASLSAPQLFLIAEDLSQMQILVSVDESDIGLIAEGEPVRFVVQAYPDDTFTGTVRQVRLQSTTVENVVNYTAVVGVENAGGRLLPGMTATVDFLIETADDVLYVSNAALRFRPTEEMIAALRARREGEGGEGGGGSPTGARGGPGRPQGGWPGAGAGNGPPDRAVLWTLDDAGDPQPVPVRTGISDGTSTEVNGPRIEAGLQIIAGVTRSADAPASSSPFGGSSDGGSRRSPGGF